jgi:hypothetical protein
MREQPLGGENYNHYPTNGNPSVPKVWECRKSPGSSEIKDLTVSKASRRNVG